MTKPISQATSEEYPVEVLLPTLVDTPFTYTSPTPLAPGTLVTTTLARRALAGVVWGKTDVAPAAARALKPITGTLPFAPLPASFLKFIDWVSEFTIAPKGAVLALAGIPHAAKTTRKPYLAPSYHPTLPELSPEQRTALNTMMGSENSSPQLKPILLDGVTGSGKTEVYFHAIANALTQPASQLLILLPEIALTHQWLERFEKTFGAPPAVWHSQQTLATRARIWQAVARGEARVVIGARSALFLPFANLSLLIVDEEHDPSYKQDEGVLYHARDMAVVRAHLAQCPVILASATPSLETLENVREGKYHAVHLPQRFGLAELPTVELIDMTANAPERGDFLSPLLKQQMLETLARREQVLLFLNRRGYAPLLLCRGCGHRFQCSNCSAWLVVHGKPGGINSLHCHHCNHREPMPPACPSCKAPPEKLAACGPGIERIAEEVRAMFGGTHVIASDPGERGNPESLHSPTLVVLSSDEAVTAEQWAAIEQGTVDIIVGTQMVAKGHHFPRLTLVGVVDADLGLQGEDLRAGERSYQLLHQLGGRAGRADTPGRVLIQTYLPQHPIMKALTRHDRDAVMRQEMELRRIGGWPPYGQLAAVLLDGTNEAQVRRAGQLLAQSAPADPRIRVLGPAPAPLSKLRGQYRFRILVKAQKGIHLQKTLRNWLISQKFPGVRIKLDVNPYYFL